MKSSTENGKDGRGKRSLRDFNKRLLALILVILMIGGAAYATFYYLFITIRGADGDYTDLSDTVAIGLVYGSDVVASFETSTTTGFTVGAAVVGTNERSYTRYYELEYPTVTATLAKKVYRIELCGGIEDEDDLNEALEAAGDIGGNDAIPAYSKGRLCVRVGSYKSASAAISAQSEYSKLDYTLDISEPSDNNVAIMHGGDILFEYDGGGESYIGLEPISKRETAYTKTPANNSYGGVFVYKPYNGALSVINLLDMQEYITGVLPWEISNSWDIEAQKVFAVAARTYAVRNNRKHFNTYGFDLCNSTCCQAYLGRNRVNDNVINAVAATRGQIVTYNGALATIYYTAISGGATVSSNDAWGGATYPYLASIDTPWEQYSDYTNGLWQNEVSPTELAQYLRDRGYSQITGSKITDINVNSRVGDTGYIKSLTFTDNKGGSLTINNSDMVRSALGKYVKSGNFVIGVGSVDYTYEVVTNLDIAVGGVRYTVVGEAYPGLFDTFALAKFSAQSADGKLTGKNEDSVVTVTNMGRKTISADEVSVMTADGYAKIQEMIKNGTMPEPKNTTVAVPDENGVASGEVLINADTKTVEATYNGSSSSNFVFAGRGWGHGIGLSQAGVRDLANAGVPAEAILKTYLPGTDISYIEDIR